MSEQAKELKLKPQFYMKDVPFYFGGEVRRKLVEDAMEFQFRTDDILIIGFPRSGTTFRRELIWLVMNDADVEKAKAVKLRDRVPGLDRALTDKGEIPAIDRANNLEGARVLFSHLPYKFFKDNVEQAGCKVICLMRNPKDVIVSTYSVKDYFLPMLGEQFAEATFDQCLQFMCGEGDRGNFIDHNMGLWKERHNPKVMILFFEEVKRDFYAAIRNVAKFAGKTLSAEQEDTIVEFLDFEGFQARKMKEFSKNDGNDIRDHNLTHLHVRKGEVGGWKNHFTVAQNEYFDKFVAEKIKEDPIPYQYTL